MPTKPPKAYQKFVTQFPQLGSAWELARDAERQGPLDRKSVRLLKLGIAMGAMRQGSVHSAVRKALAAGVTSEEIYQVLALAASTVGFPSTVALFTWVQDVLDP